MSVAFITGGSRGIGLALVRSFMAAGYRVATCATTQQSAQQSGAHLALACDITDAGQVAKALDATEEALGQLTVLVNNAGLAGTTALGPQVSDDLWHRIVDVNLNGTYYVCKHGAHRLPYGRGRIINIASVLGLRGVPDQPAYCAAKHAVVGLTRSLAQLLGPRGVTVNALCPGWTRTEMAEGRWQELGITEAEAAAGAPLGRIVEPEEVAAAAVFLASPQAGSITGQALPIDAGAIG